MRDTQDRLPYFRMPSHKDDFDKVIFLDIDGVLNNDKHVPGTPVIDESRVAYLAYVVASTNARIILSSSWKRAWLRFVQNGYHATGRYDGDLELLKKLFDRYDLVVDGYTPESDSGPYARPHEIRAWLLDHPNVTSFVILDDDDFWAFGWLDRFFVCTQTETDEVAWPGYVRTTRGMTLEHAKQAIAILNADVPLSRSDERRAADDIYMARVRAQRAVAKEEAERFAQEHPETATDSDEATEPDDE